jgi:hypothetical protein
MASNTDQTDARFGSKYHLLIITAGVFVFLLLQIPLSRYLIDDAYIHLTFARNLAESHGFSFNPGEPTYGVSAPLWTLLLAFQSLIFGASPAIAKFSSLLCGFLTIPLLFLIARKIGLSHLSAILVTVAWSVNVWLIRWSASGMESSFAVLLLIIAFGAQFDRRSSAAIWLGLAALARLEVAIFLPIFAIDQLVGRGVRKTVEFLGIFLLVFLPWNIYAWRTFGTIIPNPAQIKSDSALPPISEIVLNLKRIGGIFLASSAWEILAIVVIVIALWRASGAGKSAPMVGNAAANLTQSHPIQSGTRIIFLLAAWVILPPLFYLSRGIFVQSRYILISVPPLLLLCFFLIDWFELETAALLRFPIRYLLVSLIVVQNLVMTFVMTYPHAHLFQQTTDALAGLAAYLRDQTPAKSSVAVGDVGLIGFYSHRYVIDVEGLITRQIVPIRQQTSQSDLIADEKYWNVKRPDYVIDNSDISTRLRDIPKVGHRYEPIMSIPVTNSMIAQHKETRYYTLYRIVQTE